MGQQLGQITPGCSGPQDPEDAIDARENNAREENNVREGDTWVRAAASNHCGFPAPKPSS
jgi:hypothetical protein